MFDSRGRAYRVAGVEAAHPHGRRHEGLVTALLLPLGSREHGVESDRRLTPRETQVARLLACRATNAEIAASLGSSGHTARNHTRRILEKLGLTSKTEVREHFDCEQHSYRGPRGGLSEGHARKRRPSAAQDSQ